MNAKGMYYKFASSLDRISIKNPYMRYMRIILGKVKDKDYNMASNKYKVLKNRYLDSAINNRDWESKEKRDNHNDIYFMWLQGIENAPDVVRKCYFSLMQNCGSRNVILVNRENVFDLVKIPDYIIEKYESGIISNTHFSDIIRCKLLIDSGGYWVDGTLLVTDNKLFDKCEKYRLALPNFAMPYMVNNWFLYTQTNDNILSMTYFMLTKYWEENSTLFDYFLFQYFERMSCEYYKNEFKEAYIVSSNLAHKLYKKYFFQEFDIKEYQLLLSSTYVHKLSYKFDLEKTGKTNNTFYDVLIRKEI
ncbi:MAG: capsular polysaccharide synthesis protein [Lachnospiraceae bacterium]|nr:capsular polysaccharide synthesis protein [Lachnospiraceae bacterium]